MQQQAFPRTQEGRLFLWMQVNLHMTLLLADALSFTVSFQF